VPREGEKNKPCFGFERIGGYSLDTSYSEKLRGVIESGGLEMKKKKLDLVWDEK